MKIVFFGSSDFSLPFLDHLYQAIEHEISAVITTSPKAQGRGLKVSANPIDAYARSHGLKVLTPGQLSEPGFFSELEKCEPEMIFVASYGKYIPKKILDLTPYPINVHPSLLPKHRGPNPILAPILAGESETGVTLMKITEKMDSGPVAFSEKIKMPPDVTGGELERILIDRGIKLVDIFFEKLKANAVNFRDQNEPEATHTKKTEKHDTEFAWQDPLTLIDRKIRAYLPKPRAFFVLRGKKVFVEKGRIMSLGNDGGLGILETDREMGCVTLGLPEGRYSLEIVAPEGKNSMRAYDFLQGLRLKIGDLFQ